MSFCEHFAFHFLELRQAGLPRYITIFFCHIAIQTYMGYTEIDGRIDGERRRYTKSHSADMQLVLGHTHTFVCTYEFISCCILYHGVYPMLKIIYYFRMCAPVCW